MTGWNLVLLCGLLAGVPPAATVPPALHSQAPHLVHGLFKVGFTVPDLEAAVRALKAKGVAFPYDITKDPATGLRFAICKDAEGNEIQIFSPR